MNSTIELRYSALGASPPKQMGRVIAVANQKGGVGKTTTAINLAASLAAAEIATLLIDCDPQSNSTSGLGFPKDPQRLNTYDVLMGAAGIEQALQKTELETLWVLPAHKNLIGANIELVQAERREFRLRDALQAIRDRFYFVVIDCPPALDFLTLNALVASDSILVPMQAEYFALEGVSELLDTTERIRQDLNPGLEIEGVVLTMYDERTSLARQVTGELQKYFGEKLCVTTIPRNVRLAEAPSHGKSALTYDVRSRGAESYIRLAKEVMANAWLRDKPASPGGGAAEAVRPTTQAAPRVLPEAGESEGVTPHEVAAGSSEAAPKSAETGGAAETPVTAETPVEVAAEATQNVATEGGSVSPSELVAEVSLAATSSPVPNSEVVTKPVEESARHFVSELIAEAAPAQAPEAPPGTETAAASEGVDNQAQPSTEIAPQVAADHLAASPESSSQSVEVPPVVAESMPERAASVAEGD